MIILKRTHERRLTDVTTEICRQHAALRDKLVAQIEQAQHEADHLRREEIVLRNEIASLRGKLTATAHHLGLPAHRLEEDL